MYNTNHAKHMEPCVNYHKPKHMAPYNLMKLVGDCTSVLNLIDLIIRIFH